MTADQLTLHFKGPFVLAGKEAPLLFDDAISKRSGIYLWAVPQIDDGLIVTYVGETATSFGRRMKDHAIQMLGGNYRVSDPDQLSQGVDAVLWNGMWRPGTRDRLPEYVARVVELAPVIQRTLMLTRALVAPCELDGRARRRIEAALAQHVWSQSPPTSALLPRDIRYHARRGSEAPISLHVVADVEVQGLPAMLVA